MKTFQSLLIAFLFIFCISCQKDAALLQNVTESRDNGVQSSSILVQEDEVLSLTNITYCSPITVPLCAGQTNDMGSVTVKTGADGNIYVTYITRNNWFLKEIHLYAGPDGGIPVNDNGNAIPGQFPYAKIFSAPYFYQQYTFVIPNMASLVTIAAHASVVKLSLGNTNVILQETAWGNGCSGTQINGSTSSTWGTKFTYLKGNCEPVDICAKAINYFFDSTLNGADIPWVDVNALGDYNGNVTVGGYNYTEAEGRDIYNGYAFGTSDARDAFVEVATLKLSSTDYAQEVELLSAVTTIETWLLSRGKLNSYNMGGNSSLVRNAINYIDFWISRHQCGDRR